MEWTTATMAAMREIASVLIVRMISLNVANPFAIHHHWFVVINI